MTSTEDKLVALGTLLAGVGTAYGLALAYQGRAKEAYPFAIAVTLTTAVVSAARILGAEDRRDVRRLF